MVPGNILGEQLALANYLGVRHPTPALAYDVAETAPALDVRIQSLAARGDAVLDGPATFAAWLARNGYSSTGSGTDSDNDGTVDLLEYYFNMDPNSGAGRGNLPVITAADGQRYLSFTLNADAVGLTATLEVSDDLGAGDPWEPAVEGVDYEVVSALTSAGETTFTLRLLGGAESSFWRHDVTE